MTKPAAASPQLTRTARGVGYVRGCGVHSHADSDTSIPPSLPKFVAATLFTACLNWADFFLDCYVVLQYACVIDSDMTAGCGSGELQTCEAYRWWLAMGLSLLVISNLVQSCLWAFYFFNFLGRLLAWHAPDWLPETCAGKLGLLFLLVLLAFAQLHYLVDIAAACIVGVPWPSSLGPGEDRIQANISRELATKILESGPQLYLQSYILFVVGSHGDLMKLASVAISILALGHGLMKVMSREGITAYLRLFAHRGYWVMTFLWFSSAQALRSAGCALVLAPGARPYGMVLVALATLTRCGLTIRRRSDEPKTWSRCQTLGAGAGYFFAVCLVPCAVLDAYFASAAVPALLVRWVENGALCALSIRICNDELRTRAMAGGAGPFGPAAFQRGSASTTRRVTFCVLAEAPCRRKPAGKGPRTWRQGLLQRRRQRLPQESSASNFQAC